MSRQEMLTYALACTLSPHPKENKILRKSTHTIKMNLLKWYLEQKLQGDFVQTASNINYLYHLTFFTIFLKAELFCIIDIAEGKIHSLM